MRIMLLEEDVWWLERHGAALDPITDWYEVWKWRAYPWWRLGSPHVLLRHERRGASDDRRSGVSEELLSRDAAIEALVRAGVPPSKAEAPFPLPAVTLERDERALEKAEQWETVKLYRAFGCTVRTLSQPRATKQSPGCPDLWVSCFRRCTRAGALCSNARY